MCRLHTFSFQIQRLDQLTVGLSSCIACGVSAGAAAAIAAVCIETSAGLQHQLG
jgi:hypothetical protein